MIQPPNFCTKCSGPVDATLLGGVCPRCLLDEVFTSPQDAKAEDFGGHELLGEIARGGMGVVYRARQLDPARIVALKTLRVSSLDSPESMTRFKHEADVMVTLDHPSILPVYHCGEMDGIPFFTMKLAEGGTLADRLDRYSGQWREIAGLMVRVCDGVRHAHERGVLHRDLKPSNVLFDAASDAYVSDFGIAKLVDSQNTALTSTMAVLGTPHYLAPEIVAGNVKAASVSSDVWSLGVILYELLTGQKPFQGESVMQVLRALEMSEAIAPGKIRAEVPRDLEVITLKALAREPGTRYSSVQALTDDLRAWLEGRPITARAVPWHERAWMWARRNPALSGTAALLVLTALATVASLAWGFVRVKQENARVLASEAKAKSKLRESLFTQAHAGRLAGEMGWRSSGLNALREAYAIRPADDVRDEAVAHLAGFDLDLGGRRFERSVRASASMECYVEIDLHTHVVTGRRIQDDAELFHLPPFQKGGAIHDFAVDPQARWVAVAVKQDVTVYRTADQSIVAHWPEAQLGRRSEDGEFLPTQEKDRWVLWRTADWSVAEEIRRDGVGLDWPGFRSRPQPGNQPILAVPERTGWSLLNWREKKVNQVPAMASPQNSAWVGDYLVASLDPGDFGQAFDLRRARNVLLPQFGSPDEYFGNSNSVFMLSSGAVDAITQFWHLPTGKRLAKGRNFSVQEFGIDDRRFVTQGPQSAEGTVVYPSCFRLIPDRQVKWGEVSHRGVALSPDARLLLIHDSTRMAIHDLTTGKLLASGLRPGTVCPVFSPDGRELWVLHKKGIHLFKLTRQDSKLGLVPDRDDPAPQAGAFMDASLLTGGTGLICKMDDGNVFEWQRASGEWKSWSTPVEPLQLTATLCPISRDGRWIAGIPEGEATIYEASAPSVRHNLESTKRIGFGSFSPDSKHLIFVDKNHHWDVFEAPDWKKVASCDPSRETAAATVYGRAFEAAWSPDASWFAVVCDRTDIELVESGTWRTIAQLHGPIESVVHYMAVAADGAHLVVKRHDGFVEVWDLQKLAAEMRELGIELRLPPAVTPLPPPAELAGSLDEALLPPLDFEGVAK